MQDKDLPVFFANLQNGILKLFLLIFLSAFVSFIVNKISNRYAKNKFITLMWISSKTGNVRQLKIRVGKLIIFSLVFTSIVIMLFIFFIYIAD